MAKKKDWDSFYYNFCLEAIKTSPNYKISDQDTQNAKDLLSSINSGGELRKKGTYINCWHENPHESEAMWKLYTNPMSQGLAIKTTYRSLYNSFLEKTKIDIGRVNYIDFDLCFASVNAPFWYKRKSFEHEREVRAIVVELSSPQEYGISIPINLDSLIEDIYISPTAPYWFEEVVLDIIEKYKLDKKVNHSRIKETPFF